MSWIEENSVAVIGWIGTLLLFAFLFGKRLSKLETTDATLVSAQEKLLIAQEKLSDAVADLSAKVNGHNGNLALAEALKEFSKNFGARLGASEERLALHEIRIVKMEEMRLYLTSQFEQILRSLGEIKRNKERDHGSD